jgi:hypothetical protein
MACACAPAQVRLADQDDLSVAQALQLPDVVRKVRRLDDAVNRDGLAVGEDVDIRLLGKSLNERAAGSLPAMPFRLGGVPAAKGMSAQTLKQDDRTPLALGALEGWRFPNHMRSLSELRIHGTR